MLIPNPPYYKTGIYFNTSSLSKLVFFNFPFEKFAFVSFINLFMFSIELDTLEKSIFEVSKSYGTDPVDFFMDFSEYDKIYLNLEEIQISGKIFKRNEPFYEYNSY